MHHAQVYAPIHTPIQTYWSQFPSVGNQLHITEQFVHWPQHNAIQVVPRECTRMHSPFIAWWKRFLKIFCENIVVEHGQLYSTRAYFHLVITPLIFSIRSIKMLKKNLENLEGLFSELHARNWIQISHFSWFLERFSDEI